MSHIELHEGVPTEDQIGWVSYHAREIEKEEAAAMYPYLKFNEALRESIQRSARLWHFTQDGQICGIVGICPAILHEWRLPWMINTPIIDVAKAEFVEKARAEIVKIPHFMYQWIMKENKPSRTFAAYCGFEETESSVIGGRDFIRVERRL